MLFVGLEETAGSIAEFSEFGAKDGEGMRTEASHELLRSEMRRVR
jgi:hypothetical protein